MQRRNMLRLYEVWQMIQVMPTQKSVTKTDSNCPKTDTF